MVTRSVRLTTLKARASDPSGRGADGGGRGVLGIRDRRQVLRADLFVREEDVDRVPSPRLRAIQEHVHASDVAVGEAGALQGSTRGLKVAAPDDDVHVLRRPGRGNVHAGDPGRNGVAAGDGIGNAGSIQRGGGTREAVADPFHGVDHPFERERAKRQGVHGAILP
jgi:hypothetical protein